VEVVRVEAAADAVAPVHLCLQVIKTANMASKDSTFVLSRNGK
jgi:hypothetical protein